ncbi:MAG: DUF5652 family protein [Candidatus Woesearchaeota archaeon]|nr:DUF5652 family protein [Candidatus Woesearchaeota archaeon]
MLNFLLPFLLLDLVLRGFALYFSAREEPKPCWFIALLIFNTLGILPGIYLILRHNKSTNFEKPIKKVRRKLK